MKIQPICVCGSANCSTVISNKNTAFKGLWGDKSYNYDSGREYSSETTYLNYYPFVNETKKEIDEIVKKHTEYDHESSNATIDPITIYNATIVKVMAALPFTAKEFQAYLNDTLSAEKSKIIEKYILEKKLHI